MKLIVLGLRPGGWVRKGGGGIKFGFFGFCACAAVIFSKTCLKSTIFKIQEWLKYIKRVELNFQSNRTIKRGGDAA